jgi:hypothetical protein
MNMSQGLFGSGDPLGTLIVIAGTILTAASFVMAFRMTVSPGEKNEDHPKYAILREDH